MEGSPLELRREQRLHPALPVPGGPNPRNCTHITLPLKDQPLNTPTQTTFHVFNQSLFDVDVRWSFHRFVPLSAAADGGDGDGGDPGGAGRAAERRSVQLIAGPGGVTALVLPEAEKNAPGPFRISPACAGVLAGGSQKFTVDFVATAAGPEAGCLVGEQSIKAPEGSLGVNFLPRCGGLGDAGAVECVVTGGYHARAAPPPRPLPLLRVELAAQSVLPRLEPEFPESAAAAAADGDGLAFDVFSGNNPDRHLSYLRRVLLRNLLLCPLTFTLAVDGPFQIDPNFGSQLIALRPQEHVDVGVRFVPSQASAASGASSGGPQFVDYSTSGVLTVSFSNGTQQLIPIRARVTHPQLQGSPRELLFNAVHARSPKPLVLTLTNPTTADADWVVYEEGSDPPAWRSGGASVSGLSGGRFGPFLVETVSGTVPGRGLRMPRQQQIVVTCTPPDDLGHSRELVFAVRNGRGFRVVLQAEGTFDESQELQAKMYAI